MRKPIVKSKRGAPVTTGRAGGRQVVVRLSEPEEVVVAGDEKASGKSAARLLRDKYFRGRV